MKMLGVGVTSAVPVAASVAVYASFDDQMLAVKGVTQSTAREFEALRDKAKLLGATTSYTATQVGSLMTELGRAGFKPDQIIDMTGAVMDMARATAPMQHSPRASWQLRFGSLDWKQPMQQESRMASRQPPTRRSTVSKHLVKRFSMPVQWR